MSIGACHYYYYYAIWCSVTNSRGSGTVPPRRRATYSIGHSSATPHADIPFVMAVLDGFMHGWCPRSGIVAEAVAVLCPRFDRAVAVAVL